LKRREALWTFVQVEGVEPTNNTAERSLRPGVLWGRVPRSNGEFESG
jgi:transposase